MEFWGHPYFLQFIVPLIAVAMSVFVKYVTRNDAYTDFKKEDLAVGLDLALMALIIFISYSSKLAHDLSQFTENQELVIKTTSVPWIITAFILGIWGVSTLVRKLGWKEDDNLHVFWGIVLPDIFGILVLLYVVNWIT